MKRTMEQLQQNMVELEEEVRQQAKTERSEAQAAAASLQVLCIKLQDDWHATQISFQLLMVFYIKVVT